MQSSIRIAIDAMGGDHGPEVIVPGAALARAQYPGLAFLFFGDQPRLTRLVAADPSLAAVSSVRHAPVAVRMGDKPSQALRAGRRASSMWLALEAVKKGEADAAFSAGNTGALMAMAKICLHMIPHIDRPAIAVLWPTLRGESVVLDVGATIGADARHLVGLAIMGSAMARIIFALDRPTVGLLNVGTEEIKGIEEVKAASRILRELALPNLDYRGFVEGDDIGKGAVDVVVAEGFTGNIALKTAEGTAKQISAYLHQALRSGMRSKLGYLLARRAFQGLAVKMDPRRVNGGIFLGLGGVVIKSHGGADALGTARALEIGYEMVRDELLRKIGESLPEQIEPRAAAPASVRS